MINKYVRQIKVTVCIVAIFFLLYKLIEKILAEINRLKKLSSKHLDLYLEAIKWLDLKQKGFSIADYLSDLGYKDIAIYGMSYMGEALKNELANTEIHVKYGIDNSLQNELCDISIYKPDEVLQSVDCVVITTYGDTKEIKMNLFGKLGCPILVLDNIFDEI